MTLSRPSALPFRVKDNVCVDQPESGPPERFADKQAERDHRTLGPCLFAVETTCYKPDRKSMQARGQLTNTKASKHTQSQSHWSPVYFYIVLLRNCCNLRRPAQELCTDNSRAAPHACSRAMPRLESPTDPERKLRQRTVHPLRYDSGFASHDFEQTRFYRQV